MSNGVMMSVMRLITMWCLFAAPLLGMATASLVDHLLWRDSYVGTSTQAKKAILVTFNDADTVKDIIAVSSATVGTIVASEAVDSGKGAVIGFVDSSAQANNYAARDMNASRLHLERVDIRLGADGRRDRVIAVVAADALSLSEVV